MRALLLAVLFAVATLPVSADEEKESIDLAEMAEKIKSGEIDVGSEYSMGEKTGRFHVVHADVVVMDCESCHTGREYAPDYLLVGKFDPYRKRAKGRVERAVCLGCHSTKGSATQWYNSSASN